MSVLPVGIGASSSGYTIANSLRFRSSASAYLSRTFGTPTNNTSWALSCWLKLGALGTTRTVLAATTDNLIYFNTSNQLSLYEGGVGVRATSTAVFRDPSAHGHLFVRSNGTNIKAYWNNAEVFSYTGTITAFNSAVVHRISSYTSAPSNYFDGLMSEVYWVDNGGSLTAGDFAETNADGVWVPKKYTGTYGNNGFWLPFTGGTGGTIGNDASGNGNNWSSTGHYFTSTTNYQYDWMTDTPTNNFCIFNSVSKDPSNGTISDGNLKWTGTTTAGNVQGTMAIPATEKWRIDVTVDRDQVTPSTNPSVGFSDATLAVTSAESSFVGITWTSGTTWAIYKDGSTSSNLTATDGDTVTILIDQDAGKAWFAVNGTLVSGNPDAGTGESLSSITAKARLPFARARNSACYVTLNAGQQPWYSVSNCSSFKSICTANLPSVAITNPNNGFKATLATEDNIYTQVASARTGWTDYVDLLHNRSAAESWAWQFSHDSSNEYAISSGSVVRQAKRAMSGSNNWDAYSIRIGSTYGTAAGSVSHTNGAATTVTHNLGTTRQAIFLFPRAGGTAVPVYHPGVASGELLDLCSSAGDAVSTSITSVLSNSFQIGSGVATGTYDYLVLSEISGLLKLSSVTGNGSTDGAFDYMGGRPYMQITKRRDTTLDWGLMSAAVDTYNPLSYVTCPNLAIATDNINNWQRDFLSNGTKRRAIGDNASGGVYLSINWLSASFGSNVAPAPAR